VRAATRGGDTWADGAQELWQIFHDELDLDGNGHLDAQELQTALQRAGACQRRHPIGPPHN
jgi:hypothetical protein